MSSVRRAVSKQSELRRKLKKKVKERKEKGKLENEASAECERG